MYRVHIVCDGDSYTPVWGFIAPQSIVSPDVSPHIWKYVPSPTRENILKGALLWIPLNTKTLIYSLSVCVFLFLFLFLLLLVLQEAWAFITVITLPNDMFAPPSSSQCPCAAARRTCQSLLHVWSRLSLCFGSLPLLWRAWTLLTTSRLRRSDEADCSLVWLRICFSSFLFFSTLWELSLLWSPEVSSVLVLAEWSIYAPCVSSSFPFWLVKV